MRLGVCSYSCPTVPPTRARSLPCTRRAHADSLTLDTHFDGLLTSCAERPYSKFITEDNKHLATPEAIDFISKRALPPILPHEYLN